MKEASRRQKIHIFDHPEFGRLRVYEDENGQLIFSLEDVARTLDMTIEDAVEHLKSMEERILQ